LLVIEVIYGGEWLGVSKLDALIPREWVNGLDGSRVENSAHVQPCQLWKNFPRMAGLRQSQSPVRGFA
jgi:hypothetical protein